MWKNPSFLTKSFIQFTTIALVFLPLMNNVFLVFSTNFGSLAWRARFALCVVGLLQINKCLHKHMHVTALSF